MYANMKHNTLDIVLHLWSVMYVAQNLDNENIYRFICCVKNDEPQVNF